MAIGHMMYCDQKKFTSARYTRRYDLGRCGDPEESINHVFFECPPAVQVWALSSIPLNPEIFAPQSLFTNMDHLFWMVSPELEDHQFAWILWYI